MAPLGPWTWDLAPQLLKSWASQLPWAWGQGARPRGSPKPEHRGRRLPPAPGAPSRSRGRTSAPPPPRAPPCWTAPLWPLVSVVAPALMPPGEPARGEARAAPRAVPPSSALPSPPRWLRRCRGDGRWRPQVSAGPGPERGPHRHPPPGTACAPRGHGGLPGRRVWGSPGGPAASEGPGRGGGKRGRGAAWGHKGETWGCVGTRGTWGCVGTRGDLGRARWLCEGRGWRCHPFSPVPALCSLAEAAAPAQASPARTRGSPVLPGPPSAPHLRVLSLLPQCSSAAVPGLCGSSRVPPCPRPLRAQAGAWCWGEEGDVGSRRVQTCPRSVASSALPAGLCPEL